MSDDKALKELFDTMKQNDLDTTKVPVFESMVPAKRRRSLKPFMYTAAAVVLALLGWFTLFQDPVATQIDEDFSLSLDFIEAEQTDPLLADNPSLFEWEATTDILIKEFDD